MSYSHLTLQERYVIYHLVLYGLSYREIGQRLNRHHTAMTREVQRNGPRYTDDGVYWHEEATMRISENIRHDIASDGLTCNWLAMCKTRSGQTGRRKKLPVGYVLIIPTAHT